MPLLVFGDIYPWGQLMSASLLMAIPVMIIYIYAQRYLVEGLTAGQGPTHGKEIWPRKSGSSLSVGGRREDWIEAMVHHIDLGGRHSGEAHEIVGGVTRH